MSFEWCKDGQKPFSLFVKLVHSKCPVSVENYERPINNYREVQTLETNLPVLSSFVNEMRESYEQTATFDRGQIQRDAMEAARTGMTSPIPNFSN